MKERSIPLFEHEVRAILEGRKTMTRRVIKRFPTTGYRWNGWIVESSNRKEVGCPTVCPEGNSKYDYTGKIAARCPYGQPGDRLWVRETFCSFPDGNVFYRADNDERAPVKGWKPSIFMPRWASRITLEITSVGVERLNNISDEDATREGCEHFGETPRPAVANFWRLWESINGPGSWDANPWVWVVEFKRVEVQG